MAKKYELKDFMKFEFRNGGTLLVIPEDIPAVGAACSDNTQTKLFVKGVVGEQLVVMDTPENVAKQIEDFKNKRNK